MSGTIFCSGTGTTFVLVEIKLGWSLSKICIAVMLLHSMLSSCCCVSSNVPMFLRMILGSLALPEEGGAVVYHEAKVGLGRQRLQQAAGQVQIMHQACRQGRQG